MIVNDVRIACPLGLDIPEAELAVDREFVLEVLVRVAGVRRDTIDVTGFDIAGETRELAAGLSLDLIAIADKWPEPAPVAEETPEWADAS